MPKVIKDKEAMQKRGDILLNLRKQRNINQSTIADILGISQQAYLKYEHGDADPTIDALCKLSDFYCVTTDYLLGREKPVKPDLLTMLTQEFHLNELEKVLVQAYINISPKEREKFIQNIEEAVKQKEKTQQAPEAPIIQQPPPTDIQISKMSSEFAIARGGKGYKKAPTDEQFSMLEEVTPAMLGEE